MPEVGMIVRMVGGPADGKCIRIQSGETKRVEFPAGNLSRYVYERLGESTEYLFVGDGNPPADEP